MNKNPTILAVDDDPESRARLVALLTPAGYQVQPEASGDQALASMAVSAPDLILLAVRMPGIDGLEVCRRLKAREATRHVPVILLHESADRPDWPEGFQLGAADCLAKPVEPGELLARVKTHLSLRWADLIVEQQAAVIHETNEQLRSEIVGRQRVADELRESLDQTGRARRALIAATEELRRAEAELQAAQAEVRSLTGLLPLCTSCRKIRDEGGAWHPLEAYSQSQLAAGALRWVCPDCSRQLHANLNLVPHGPTAEPSP